MLQRMLLLICLLYGIAAAADSWAEPPPANKLTVAYYNFSSGKDGFDINLRHTFKSTTGWIGGYHESGGFQQARLGFEYDYQHDWLTFVPSVQAATRGFVGATLYGEAGSRFYAIGGFGRTNLHPYWNLGFDPNDYLQFGAGYHYHTNNTISVFAIRDIRLGTGQTNTHFYFRHYLPHTFRLTLDVVNERGQGENNLEVRAWSISADLNWRRWFVRVARDPHVNYTSDRQIRLAGGLRF